MKRVLIFGDSHIHAIKRACKLRREENQSVSFVACRLTKLKNGVAIGDLDLEGAARLASELKAGDLLVSAIGGNQHNALGLIQHPVPFDLVGPGEMLSGIARGATIIPYTALWDTLEASLRRRDEAVLASLRKSTSGDMYHLVPPPPKSNETHILSHHETDFAKAGILEKGVSPASLRLKLWKLHVRVLEKLCAEKEIRLITPPAEAVTEEGFLRAEYYASDATHANAAYGELVLNELETIATDSTTERGAGRVRASV